MKPANFVTLRTHFEKFPNKLTFCSEQILTFFLTLIQSLSRYSGAGYDTISSANGSLRRYERRWEDPNIVLLDRAVIKRASERSRDGETAIRSRSVGIA